jgi:subtilisin family serine protease
VRLRAPGAWTVVVAVLIASLVPAGRADADQTRDAQWFLGFLDVARAQQISQGDGAVVGVVDSGVDGRHPDLTGNVLPGADMLGLSDDGWNDTLGHGTGMAGLIAAHGHGGGGALGTAPRAKILPVNTGIMGTDPRTAAGIDWAVAHGAIVLCLAIAGPPSPLLQRAVENAIAHDIVVVAGAGNAAATSVDYPAAYPGVVTAAGVERGGEHAVLSNSGPQVTLAAPAVDVLSTAPGGTYRTGTGTSDATAIIAGAAALVRSKYPKMPATEVIHRLTATAIDKGPPGRDDLYGYGIVNLVGALTADLSQPSSPPPPVARPAGHRRQIALIGAAVAVLAAAGLVLAVVRLRTRTRTKPTPS